MAGEEVRGGEEMTVPNQKSVSIYSLTLAQSVTPGYVEEPPPHEGLLQLTLPGFTRSWSGPRGLFYNEIQAVR